MKTAHHRWTILALMGVVLALGIAAERGHRHSAFHRSKSFEHRRWAELAMVYPTGTSADVVLSDLGLARSDLLANGGYEVVDVRIPLEIAASDHRDYPGFRFTFRQLRLESIHPIGPDGAGADVSISPALQQKLQTLYQR